MPQDTPNRNAGRKGGAGQQSTNRSADRDTIAGGIADESGSGRGDFGSGPAHADRETPAQQQQRETVSGMPGRGELGANQDEPMAEADIEAIEAEQVSGREAEQGRDDIGDGNNAGGPSTGSKAERRPERD